MYLLCRYNESVYWTNEYVNASVKMDPRREKAQDLANRASIRFADGCYTVPSQSGNGSYTVILDDGYAVCDCPDFELRGDVGKPCKHIMASRLWRDRQARGVEQEPTDHKPSKKVKRPTYKQDWPNYNAAQVNEQGHLQEFLTDLCRNISTPTRTTRGRKPIPLADQAFAVVLKVYSLFSARRFMGDLEEAVERGNIGQTMHFNSVLKALENAKLTPILQDMIRQSAMPLAAIETDFAPDSTGFCTSRFTRWFDVKYGVTREEADWVKAHIMTGVQTNVVTAVEIQEKHAGDAPQFPQLLGKTAKDFKVKEVSADKAYCSSEAYELVNLLGGTLYAPFKTNATGGVGGVFEKMYFRFCLEKEDFLSHYHKRSNVESTISMVKRKFGDSVRSKTDTAMKNEVLAKFICHNLCCLTSAMYELGIVPKLGNEEANSDILSFKRNA
jgi:transposase